MRIDGATGRVGYHAAHREVDTAIGYEIGLDQAVVGDRRRDQSRIDAGAANDRSGRLIGNDKRAFYIDTRVATALSDNPAEVHQRSRRTDGYFETACPVCATIKKMSPGSQYITVNAIREGHTERGNQDAATHGSYGNAKKATGLGPVVYNGDTRGEI